jgi:hypothetical protein
VHAIVLHRPNPGPFSFSLCRHRLDTFKENMATDAKVNVLMVGTGEYTTGYVGGRAADSDKGAGVVALTMFDLRRRDKVDRIGMCGVNVSSKVMFTFLYPCKAFNVGGI